MSHCPTCKCPREPVPVIRSEAELYQWQARERERYGPAGLPDEVIDAVIARQRTIAPWWAGWIPGGWRGRSSH